MNFWDQNFSAPGYKYGTLPNAFLREQASALPSQARVLVPGDGEGRNGVWLATQGHQVCSVDMSRVGLAKAQALATEQGVSLQTEVVDLAEWVPPVATFDAVVLTYVHLPPATRQQAHRRLWSGLKPGGLWLLEAFHPQQLQHSSGGPKDVAMLYTVDLLRSDLLGDAEVELAWDGEVTLDEGPGHQGTAHVVRLLARRSD